LSAKEHTLQWTHKDGLPYFIFTVISPLMRKLQNRMFQKYVKHITAYILSIRDVKITLNGLETLKHVKKTEQM
jgi:hypothetical protein